MFLCDPTLKYAVGSVKYAVGSVKYAVGSVKYAVGSVKYAVGSVKLWNRKTTEVRLDLHNDFKFFNKYDFFSVYCTQTHLTL